MTLEVLFAQATQGRTFLQMALLGAALALCVQLSGLLHQARRWLGNLADLLTALGLTLALGWILLHGGELRLYALLGLMIGSALYAAGPGAALRWGLARWHAAMSARSKIGRDAGEQA